MNIDFLETLLSQNESDHLDFKATLYKKEQYESLLKDVLAMANSKTAGSRYIIMGIKEKEGGQRNIIGITETVDPSNYQQFIFENIEPILSCELNYITYKDTLLAILEIVTPKEQPYILRRQYRSLHKGFCYVRRGATNDFATRADFDYYYKQGRFEMRILDSMLRAVNPDSGCAALECSFRNLTDFPITIQYGILEVWDKNSVRSKHRLFGQNHEIVGAEFHISLPPKSETVADFLFNFESSDCLRLGLNEYGFTDESFQFKLKLVDTTSIEYSITVDNCNVFAKGDFLWKVKFKK
ncbi:AlbA family DNA-binding domain-containing protein [Bacillus sp. FJAT-29937]|uniref:AlbA family DNA-binding domain-containing protein n=1 Tax=Bacillus sp. FJAT-29937 TaxID=1720553 RepID=UPI00082DBF3E|nr:ATP-binding protein [Bacillus sp. FJAT-29937]